MRYLIPAMLAGVFLAGSAASVSAEGVAIPQDPERLEQRWRDMLAWNRRTLGGEYEKVGKKNPRWDGHAREALDAAARVFSHVLEPYTDWVHVYNAADTAIMFGCDDPLILYLYARSSQGPSVRGQLELDRRYTAAAKAMQGSAYPPFRRIVSLYKAAEVKLTRANNSEADRRDAESLIAAALDLLPKSMAEDQYTVDVESCRNDCVWAAIEVHEKLTNDRKSAFDRVDAVLAKSPSLRVLRLKVKGAFFKEYAWVARGRGYADTVSKENWRKFDDRLTVARKALEEAWDLRPGDFQTANEMLWVELGQSHGRAEMEKWFERAMKAEGNNSLACSTKLEWLAPRWYGTREEMLAFGRACRDTKNWRAGITLLVADAHYNVRLELPTEGAKNEYMRRTDVWEDIATVYTEYLKKNYTDHSARSRFAMLCYLCGRYSVSHRQFLLLGDNLCWDWHYSEKVVKDTRNFVVKYADEPAKEVAAKGKIANTAAKNSTAKGKSPDQPPKNSTAKARAAPPPAEAVRTREFAAQNCRFTLPDKNWFWTEVPADGMFCTAENARGFVLMLGAVRPGNARARLPEFKSAAEYEKGLYEAGKGEVTKRGGHFLTFNGLRCYQAESLLKDGRTSACRAFIADGQLFELVVIGSKEPVEQDPDFERIMSGFAFMNPPAQAGTGGGGVDQTNVSYRLGQLAGWALIGLLVAFVARAFTRKKKPPVRRNNIDDDRAFAVALGESVPAPKPIPPLTPTNSTGEQQGRIKAKE